VRFLLGLVNLGVGEASRSAEVRQVRLTNATVLFAMASVLVYNVIYLSLSPSVLWAAAVVTVACLGLYVAVLALNARGHHHAAKVVHTITTLSALVVSTTFGVGQGIQYYFYIFAILPPLLWSPKQWPWIALMLILTLVGYLGVEAVSPALLEGRLPLELRAWFRLPAVVLSFVSLVAVVLVAQGQVERREQKLEAQKDEIEEQNRWKDRLFGIVAHDLRNPFTAFETSLEVLVRRYDTLTDRERKDWLALLLDSSSQTGQLLEGLLQWAKDLMLSSQPKPEDFRLEDVVLEEFVQLLPLAEHKAIGLSWDGPSELQVHADRTMTKTLLRNLITNALKFTRDGGSVRVTADEHSHCRWRISVIDNGVGIEAGRLAKLFDSDKRQTTRGTRQEPGTGLGLILCRDFARKNGGELVIQSTVGTGSVFSFDLQRGR
jgi:signal transduction histidine kinase